VILDEIQRRPDLMPLLRVLADRRSHSTRFLLLGSASPDLVRRSSESLAGRVEFVQMGGFSLREVGWSREQRLWTRGGFPRSFLAPSELDSAAWRENFIITFLERDIPQLGVRIPAVQLRRFWTMVAHLHGNVWNASEIAGSLGITHPTARRYLDLLTGAFMLRQLTPWFVNTGKRLVKSPKVYLRDSGLLHSLLNVENLRALEGHPKYGLSWEGFAMEQILHATGERDAYFWSTHGGAELDLLLVRRGKRWGVEFKSSEAPAPTKSMRMSMKELNLEHLWVVYPGKGSFPMDKKIDAVSLPEALQHITKRLT
jgi:predicted AAA+ superfamily ATPase